MTYRYVGRVSFLLLLSVAVGRYEAYAAQATPESRGRRVLADVFSLNIPGFLSVDVAAPPKSHEGHGAKAPGPSKIDVQVDVQPKDWEVTKDVHIDKTVDDDKKDVHIGKTVDDDNKDVHIHKDGPKDEDVHIQKHAPKYKEAKIEEDFSVEKDKDFTAIKYNKLNAPAPSPTAEEKSLKIDVGGRKLLQANVNYPGGNVQVHAPGPGPDVAVNFPGGNVRVDPQSGTQVRFPGGSVNVGRKLQAPGDDAREAAAEAHQAAGNSSGGVTRLADAQIDITLPPLPARSQDGAEINSTEIASLTRNALEALPALLDMVYPIFETLPSKATTTVWDSAFKMSLGIDLTVSPANARRLMRAAPPALDRPTSS